MAVLLPGLDVQYKRSKWNLADLFTKPVDAVTARRLIGRLNGYSDFVNGGVCIDGDETPNASQKFMTGGVVQTAGFAQISQASSL